MSLNDNWGIHKVFAEHLGKLLMQVPRFGDRQFNAHAVCSGQYN
jgi:hypothetical protein